MRTDLELAILADPDVRAAYAVYADWLLEHGDPDGELIAVQLALEDAPGDAALPARERKLLAAKEDQLRRATASWPRLERLVLDVGTSRAGDLTPPDLFVLLDSPPLPPGLRTLGLRNCAFGKELILALSRLRLLPCLQHLELSHMTLDDAGARALLAHADAFRHLATLNLRRTHFTPAIHEALTRLGPHVELDRY